MKRHRVVAIFVGLAFGGTAAVAAPAGRSVVGYPDVTLTVLVGGTGAGNVVSDPPGIDCATGGGTGCSHSFPHSADVELTATPVAGSSFGSWTGCPAPVGQTCLISPLVSNTQVTATLIADAVPPAPQAKSVHLRASPTKVRKGKKTKLVATVTPCVVATRNDTVQFRHGSSTIADLPLSPSCQAELMRTMKKAATFSAFSPGDADSVQATSGDVKVKVKDTKKGKKKKGKKGKGKR